MLGENRCGEADGETMLLLPLLLAALMPRTKGMDAAAAAAINDVEDGAGEPLLCCPPLPAPPPFCCCCFCRAAESSKIASPAPPPVRPARPAICRNAAGVRYVGAARSPSTDPTSRSPAANVSTA